MCVSCEAPSASLAILYILGREGLYRFFSLPYVSAQHGVSGVNSVHTGSSSQGAVGRRASGGRPQGHRSFWPNRRSTEDPPPYFSKPGAFIRTEGQQPKYEAAAPPRAHTIDGGSFIDINDRKAVDVGKAPSLQWGPKDTLPSPNPVSATSGSGGNSITPNSTINITNGNQSGGNGGSAKDNGFGGGTGFDPAF